MRLPVALMLAASVCQAQAPAPVRTDSTWQQHDAAADAALDARDYRGYLHHLQVLEGLLSGHPGVVYGVARAHALLGHGDSALTWLGRYADMGLMRDISQDSAFETIRTTAEFAAIAGRLAGNGMPRGSSELVLTLPDSTLLIEDLAWDPRTRTWYLTSVHQRRILAIGPDGATRDFVPAGGSGLLVPFAIALDTARNLLWVASAGAAEGLGIRKEEIGRTGVLAFDLHTGRQAGKYDLPDDGTPRSLGDLALLDDGTLVVSDSRGGGVYRLAPGGRLELLVPPGVFRSPQGAAGIPGTPYVLVADYVRGIARVDRRDGTLTWLPHPPDLAINGVDGLRLRGQTLVVVQNGIRPGRVARLTLDARLERITSWQTLVAGSPGLSEPTHGVFVGDGFVFVATSGWASMGDDGNWRPGAVLERPVVRRIAVGR